MRTAPSTSLAFMSFIFVRGDLAQLRRGHAADGGALARRSCVPFVMPAAFFRK